MLGYLRAVLGRIGLGRGRSATDDGTDETDPDDEGAGSVWDFIPGRQYSGQHAESGGIARGEQERAIRDIERKTEIVESQHDHRDPAVDRGDP